MRYYLNTNERSLTFFLMYMYKETIPFVDLSLTNKTHFYLQTGYIHIVAASASLSFQYGHRCVLFIDRMVFPNSKS